MSQRFFFNPIRHTSLGLAVLGCRWSAWQLRSSCPLFIMVAQGLLAPPVPRELAIEAKITENMTTTIDQLKEIAIKVISCARTAAADYTRSEMIPRIVTGAIPGMSIRSSYCRISKGFIWKNLYGFLSGCRRNAITCYCSWRTMRQMPARRQSLMESSNKPPLCKNILANLSYCCVS
jgi:hypothetical protein